MPRLRRLGNSEIEIVLTEISGEPLAITRAWLADPRAQGYDNDATALVVSESKFEELGIAAERVAALLTRPERLFSAAPCESGAAVATSATSQLTCGRAFVTEFAGRAWGRPPTPAEIDALMQAFTKHATNGNYGAGIAVVIEAMLMSPHFVYRTELGAGDAVNPLGDRRLTGVEIASAIAFLVRGGRPDAPLLAAGLAGDLENAAQRRAHAERLVATAAGRQQMARFVRSWLGLDDVAMINKDLAIYPSFTPSVRRSLDRELTTLLEHVFANEEGRLSALMFADYTFPGPALAEIYGQDLLAPIGDFTRVRLDPKRRRGLLASPAFLARHALINQTNPVERGLLISNRLLCRTIPAPPEGVVAVPPEGGPETTTRKKYEAHRADPKCYGCHQFMDALGFGLEEFDAIGRYRTTEGPNPVDAQGEIVGTDVDGDFTGPVELAQHLLDSALSRRCVVEQMYRFANGREVETADRAEIDHLAWLFAQNENRLPALFVEMVARPNFILRKAAPPQEAP